MKNKLLIFSIIALLILGFAGAWKYKESQSDSKFAVGQKIDVFNGVAIFYNGGVGNISGRNMTADGYNLGLKYQCVEFVKRYYYEYFDHKMPDSYGHAKDFYSKSISDGKYNTKRDLTQYSNPSNSQPQVNDLLIFSGSIFNKFGHVAIISKVSDNEIEIIQQNPGPFGKSRETISLNQKNGKWEIKNGRVLGWLRKS
jgi:surface antigen